METEFFVYLYEPTEDTVAQILSVQELKAVESELYPLLISKSQEANGPSLFSILYKNKKAEIYVFRDNKLTVTTINYDNVKWVPIPKNDSDNFEQVRVNVTSFDHIAVDEPFRNVPSTVRKIHLEYKNSNME